MRQLILNAIQNQINEGDVEIVNLYGPFNVIAQLDDQALLEVYTYMVGFRG